MATAKSMLTAPTYAAHHKKVYHALPVSLGNAWVSDKMEESRLESMVNACCKREEAHKFF